MYKNDENIVYELGYGPAPSFIKTTDIIDNLIFKSNILLKELDGHEIEIRESYKKAYLSKDLFDYDHRYYSQEIEKELPGIIKNTLEKIKRYLEEIKTIKLDAEHKFTSRIEEFVLDYLSYVQNLFDTHEDIISWITVTEFADRIDHYKSISLLKKFANIDENIVLIGANGSGKSTLAQILKGNEYEKIVVIPAQKSLFFTTDSAVLSSRINDVNNDMHKNSIEFSKSDTDYEFNDYQKYHFSRLLNAMRENYNYFLRNLREQGLPIEEGHSIYDKVRKIINIIYKDIDIKFGEPFDEYIYCIRGKDKYHINGLSEGEKAALYYSMSVLMAPDNSFIVIDEPETYLNPSIANTLWDLLIKERKDCQFVFITHSINFTIARNGFKIIWIKDFKYPDQFTFETIDDNFNLPRILMTEILGSKKPVLFCEGDSKGSLDYKVYSALFGEKYTVIPVGTHKSVENYCNVLNESDWIGIDAKGIIDGDIKNKEIKEKLKGKYIFSLPFNEVEMLLVSDLVMEYTIQGSQPQNYNKVIDSFKKELWNYIENEKERIINEKTRVEVNDIIESRKIESFRSLEDIQKSVNNIIDLDVENIYKNNLDLIDKIIKTKDYDKLLEVCNLKKEITRKLANKYLDSNYENKAIEYLNTNKTLQELFIKKYLQELAEY